jgi:hypothetical protein
VTRTLRARHRHAVGALAATLPLAVALALAVRPQTPSTALPPELGETDAPIARPLWQATFGDGGSLRVRATLGSPESPDGTGTSTRPSARERILELEAQSGVGQPELLAYWAAAHPGGDGLPPGAILLGALPLAKPRRFRLPPAPEDGVVIVYDLAHARVVVAERVGANGGDAS